jgi:hypothetical protein
VSLIDLDDARVRVPSLPLDDLAAQAIIDEQEAWLARRIGALTGSRTETFYTGISVARHKLSLARYTDAVSVTDSGVTVDPSRYLLIDRGSAIAMKIDGTGLAIWWNGPYVAVTYEPNDLLEVQRVLYALLALESDTEGAFSTKDSEQIGSYSYHNSLGTPGATTPTMTKAALVASLLPVRVSLASIRAVSRRLTAIDPVINRAEVEVNL